jgi:predicted RNA-binding Zn-ribbon protein involved in translation (DUF1610 family)
VSSDQTVKIGTLEVMTKDLGRMPAIEATKACVAIGEGWRLPTRDELTILFEHRSEIGGFSKEWYWSSTRYAATSAWVRSFSDGQEDSDHAGHGGGASCVRAVRSSREPNVAAEAPPIPGQSGDPATFQCERCRKTDSHRRVTDQYAGDLWVCPSCGYKTYRAKGL